ncbi:MAG: hypothetical protein IJ060_09330 [Oscillospiraceae bacterium]|nr:hypothetical protein [Oscillospiraceae bacterium]
MADERYQSAYTGDQIDAALRQFIEQFSGIRYGQHAFTHTGSSGSGTGVIISGVTVSETDKIFLSCEGAANIRYSLVGQDGTNLLCIFDSGLQNGKTYFINYLIIP